MYAISWASRYKYKISGAKFVPYWHKATVILYRFGKGLELKEGCSHDEMGGWENRLLAGFSGGGGVYTLSVLPASTTGSTGSQSDWETGSEKTGASGSWKLVRSVSAGSALLSSYSLYFFIFARATEDEARARQRLFRETNNFLW